MFLGAPLFPELAQLLFRSLRALVVVAAPRRRLKDHESDRPLRVRRRVERRHRRALVAAEDDGALGAHGVEHRVQVLHPRLEGRELAAAVGQAGPALVEEDQAERAGEPFVELAIVGRLPGVDEVGDVVRHETRSVGPSPTTWYAIET